MTLPLKMVPAREGVGVKLEDTAQTSTELILAGWQAGGPLGGTSVDRDGRWNLRCHLWTCSAPGG